MARDKLDMSISEYCENQLRAFLGEEDQLSKLLRKEAKLQSELDVVQAKICQLRDRNRKKSKQKKVFDEAMIPINRIHERLGYVGRNQIRKIAHQNDIPPQQLIEHCEELKLNLKNFAEVPK